MYLLRKSAEMAYEDIVIPVIDNKYEKWLNELRQQVNSTSTPSERKRIWLLSEDSNYSGITGLVNCLRNETHRLGFRCVFITKGTRNLPEFNLKNEFYRNVAQKNLVMNVFQNGSWGSFRHLTITKYHGKVETNQVYLNISTKGDFSSLVWIDSPIKYLKHPTDSIPCQVYYAPLNLRDVMLASGEFPLDALPDDFDFQDCILGLEFSGRLKNGQRVMGLVPAKGLASTVDADPHFVWEVPDDWSLEEASTVPLAYSTAYYALIIRGNLRKGENVLIHSGSGGVEQAAIAVALSLGCQVFISVDSTEKQEFLKKHFKALKDRNFCNSRDESFEQYILNSTNGEGVDVILNSGKKLKASLNCLVSYGRYLEVEKYDLFNNTLLGVAIFLKKISYLCVNTDELFENKIYYSRIKKEVAQLVKDGIIDGTVKPLNSVLFNCDQAEQAFRFMAGGKHLEKVVLKIRSEESKQQTIPTSLQIKALSRTTCNPEKSYVIIGGSGFLGLELCQWLVERGARHVFLTSRSGLKSGYQKLWINRWKKDNINITHSNLNASKIDDTKSLLKMAAQFKPVAAIFNLAMVLRGAFLVNQTVETFNEVWESKVSTTLNLDAVSREFCPELEWFVCFSSISSGRGVAGYCHYGYANSVMERICEERSKEGLPGLAVQWGPIGDWPDAVLIGVTPQSIHSYLEALEKLLNQKHPVVSCIIPYQPPENSTQKTSALNFMPNVAKIFGKKDMSAFNPELTLRDLGMDSMTAVEVKILLKRDLNLELDFFELRELKVKNLEKLEETFEITKTTTKHKSEATPTVDFTSESSTKASPKIYGHFRSLSSKELVPAEPIIQMNSVKIGIPLFIVHPIEGTVTMLKSLAQRINLPVYGIQCTLEAPSESIEKLAAWYWKLIKKLKLSNTIYLAGYSFGGAIAFEMCLQSEYNSQLHVDVRNIIMLDGSPAFCTTYIWGQKLFFRGDSKVEDEAKVLCSYVLKFVDINIREFQEELMNLSTFADRVKISVEKISSNNKNLQPEDLTVAFDLYYKKILMSFKYTPRHILSKEVLLIKASDSVEMTKYTSETYDLEKFCDGKITAYTVEGTLENFTLAKGEKDVSKHLSDIFSL